MSMLKYTKKPISFVGITHKIPSFLDKIPSAPVRHPLLGWLERFPSLKRILKRVLRPSLLVPIINYKNTLTYLFIDGYIQRTTGYYIRRYIKEGNILEVGIGSGKLIKYINLFRCYYYGFDIYNVSPLAGGKNIHLFIASAEDIPLPDNSIDAIISTEVFEHIPNIRKAFNELYRIAKPGAKMIVSIPNNYCYKYRKKGPHPEHVNYWHYQDLINELSPRFRLLEGRMNGYWIPIMQKSCYSLQLPFSHLLEYLNSNFFYVFECLKRNNGKNY